MCVLDRANDRKNYTEICSQFHKAGIPHYNRKHKFEPGSPIAQESSNPDCGA